MGRQISIYLDNDIFKIIKKIAEEENRSFNYTLNKLLREAIFSIKVSPLNNSQ